MAQACNFIPNAANGNESILFRDLNNRIKNREAVKSLYAFTRTALFRSEFSDMPVDKNGEITYDALNSIFDIERTFSDKEKDNSKAISTGVTNRNGRPSSFDSPDAAMEAAERYNDTAEKSVATVRKDGNKYVTEVNEKDTASVAEADRNRARARLNASLISYLNKLGFGVTVEDNLNHPGIFDPTRAEWNADTLKNAIAISKGESGYEALPEEFSHLMLAGLRNHELKKRADLLFTDDVVRMVLGNDYNRYYRLYNGKSMPVEDLLRDEAEGKVLADLIKTESSFVQDTPYADSVSRQPGIINIIRRIWNAIKSMFRKASVSDIDNLIADARNAMRDVLNVIESDDIETVIDRELIKANETMYNTQEQVEKMAEIAEQGEVLLAQRLDILKHSLNEAGTEQTKTLTKSIIKIRDDIEKQQYYAACSKTLANIGTEILSIMDDVKKLGYIHNTSTDLNVISREAETVKTIYTIVTGYMPYIVTMKELPDLVSKGEINMDADAANRLATYADMYKDHLDSLAKQMSNLRYSVLKQVVTLFYGNMGEAPDTFEGTEENRWKSVDTILQYADKDINWFDGNVFSAGDSRNPLLNVIHNIVVTTRAKRDNEINKYCAAMQEADTKLRQAGFSNEFVYELDERGTPTGFYKAPVDIARYYRDREAFKDSMDIDVIGKNEFEKRLAKWDEEHLEEVEVGKVRPDGTRRKETMPRAYAEDGSVMYAIPDFQAGWSQAQKDYYAKLIEMKAEMDEFLPEQMRCLYGAPQVRKSVTQMFDKGPKNALKTVWGDWKRKNMIVSDNTNYGNIITSLDFNGKEIKRVPIYFVERLDDLKDLSTDATHAMFNFMSMAVNFREMNKLSAAMSLMQDYVSDTSDSGYDVRQVEAGKPIIESFMSVSKQYYRQMVKRGEGTNISKAIVKYIDRQFYGKTRKPLPDINVLGKTISLEALANALLNITSKSRIGLNVLSGITNITQGETQIIEEATTGRYFNGKDYAWAKAEYNALLPAYMGEFNSADRHDKMYMLINQFNSSEDFFRDMMDKDFNKSALKRVVGRGNIFFLNAIGEHYLHTTGMLMVLNHEKVKRLSDNKETTLYKVIKQVHDENGWHLELDDDIQFLDTKKAFLNGRGFTDGIVRKSDRDKLFEGLNTYINNINAEMHGGYSEAEKGNINQSILMRFFNQFRQWMWGMYNKLYSGSYYDAVMGVQKEGVYVSVFKFWQGLLHDMKNMSIKEAWNSNSMSPAEKKKARIAWTQAGIMGVLALLCWMTQGWKDDDEMGHKLLAYSIMRLRLETGALTPSLEGIRNITTLVQSPAAGVKSLEGIAEIFNIGNYWNEINSGRFKGWSKAEKTLYTLTPIYNIQKVIDMKDYNYMFNIFKFNH